MTMSDKNSEELDVKEPSGKGILLRNLYMYIFSREVLIAKRDRRR